MQDSYDLDVGICYAIETTCWKYRHGTHARRKLVACPPRPWPFRNSCTDRSDLQEMSVYGDARYLGRTITPSLDEIDFGFWRPKYWQATPSRAVRERA